MTTSKLTTFRSALVFASALTTLALTTTSFASSPTNAAPSVAVRYDDLNLSSDVGVEALYRRISNAARQVCPDAYSRDLRFAAASKTCQANAVARAVNDVSIPKLAQVHASHVSHG